MSTLGIIAIVLGVDILIDIILFFVILGRLRKMVQWGRRSTPIEVNVYRNW
jgi:hypothetical protein